MISFLLPTHDRPASLRRTVESLGALSGEAFAQAGGAEVIVMDCASTIEAQLPRTLDNGLPVMTHRLDVNNPAQARNRGAALARGAWIVMLDDDSYPIDEGVIQVIRDASADTAAIGGEVLLADGSHEVGGLPEVFIGCGVAIRRQAYLDAGGYDEAFVYYAEEYDLCAKLLGADWRIEHDFRFRILHHKDSTGRDMNRILEHLVRNNARVMQRYAPETCRNRLIDESIARCQHIAEIERGGEGLRRGLQGLNVMLREQPDRAMDAELFDRFSGAASARVGLGQSPLLDGEPSVAIVDDGKQVEVVRRVLDELGVEVVDDEDEAEVLVIGTLSPGPMVDAFMRRRTSEPRVLMPWWPSGFETRSSERGTIVHDEPPRQGSHRP